MNSQGLTSNFDNAMRLNHIVEKSLDYMSTKLRFAGADAQLATNSMPALLEA